MPLIDALPASAMTPAEVLASLRSIASKGVESVKQRAGQASARLRGAAPQAPVAPAAPAAVPPAGEEIKPAAVPHGAKSLNVRRIP